MLLLHQFVRDDDDDDDARTPFARRSRVVMMKVRESKRKTRKRLVRDSRCALMK
jgi:hypothetical protein